MFRFRLITALALLWLALGSVVLAEDFPKGTFVASRQPDWSLKFEEKGKFSVIRGGKPLVEGTYKATATELTMTDEKGPFAASEEGLKTGKYKWKLDEGKLKFTLVEDKSKGRELLLTLNEWAPPK